MEIRDRVREEIRVIVCNQCIEMVKQHSPFPEDVYESGEDCYSHTKCQRGVKITDQLLSIKIDDRYELAVVDRKAELPRIQKWPHSADYELGALHTTYAIRNDGWVKEVK